MVQTYGSKLPMYMQTKMEQSTSLYVIMRKIIYDELVALSMMVEALF